MCAENAEKGGYGIGTNSVPDANERSEKNWRKVATIENGSIRELVKSPTESILEGMFNLACHAGHRWFSPHPEDFYGRLCNAPNDTARGCPLLLHPIRLQEGRNPTNA